jgi:hypothetical protein
MCRILQWERRCGFVENSKLCIYTIIFWLVGWIANIRDWYSLCESTIEHIRFWKTEMFMYFWFSFFCSPSSILLLLYFLRALQSMMNLGLFYDCSPLAPIVWLSSPVYNTSCLQILSNWNQQPDRRSAHWSKYPPLQVVLASCKGSAPPFWKGIAAISTAVLWSLSLYLVHYIIFKVYGYTLMSTYHIS